MSAQAEVFGYSKNRIFSENPVFLKMQYPINHADLLWDVKFF